MSYRRDVHSQILFGLLAVLSKDGFIRLLPSKHTNPASSLSIHLDLVGIVTLPVQF